ncbi:MAG: DUF1501 domain-containing protein [Gammaproteobacteria bacterium]
MDRRSFISSLLASGALIGSGSLTGGTFASPFSTAHRTLVSVLLSGGPDFRHLMPPAYSEQPGSYGYEYWQSMASSHGAGQSASELQARFNSEYDLVGDNQTEFGMLKSCGWLKQMWEDGNVAIIHNVLGSSSRNHPLSILASEIGNRALTSPNSRAPGIGGRLAELSAQNLLSLTPVARSYCYGPSASNAADRSTDRVVIARDTRAFTLFEGDTSESAQSYRNEITRNVAGYYSAKFDTGAPGNLSGKFLSHENKLRQLGEPINERLSTIPVPASLERLYTEGLNPLFSAEFGLQVRNLYDSLACSDILNMGVATLEYRGFDSHREQIETLEPRFEDLFGDQQALASLYSELPSDVSDELVFAFSGEFGRQIRSNGDGGTDHGEGSSIIVIGKPVVGGVYGEAFPESELALRDEPSPQILGQTAIERVHAMLADWHTAGSGAALFPELGGTPLESGLDLSGILPGT